MSWFPLYSLAAEGGYMFLIPRRFWTACVLLAFLTSGLLRAQPQISLTPGSLSPVPVGETVLWAAQTDITGPPAPLYRFESRRPGEAWRMLRDWSYWPGVLWTDLREGLYEIRGSVLDNQSGLSAETIVEFTLTSRVVGTQAVVSETSNPLVALFSAAPCPIGSKKILFRRVGASFSQETDSRTCQPGQSINFYVAGMRASTTYEMAEQWTTPVGTFTGSPLLFETGAVPLSLPNSAVLNAADGSTSLQESVLLTSVSNFILDAIPVATDLFGNVIWYYESPGFLSGLGAYLTRPVTGGTFLTIAIDPVLGWGALREVDLAGNIVRETNPVAVSRQLRERGEEPVGVFHHDAWRLPNGNTLVLGSVERILTDVQGAGPVDILGDLLIELDEAFQVVWTWNAFDHLDPGRRALLDEKCEVQTVGCPPIFLDSIANDWTHANAITYLPDGNVLLSLRNQDWVIKIDFDDGNGTGAVLWRLGRDGDFILPSNNPWPWFSHQHHVELQGGQIVLFDNGNTRVEFFGSGNSRGQAYIVSEGLGLAFPVLNADLGVYAPIFGSAQRLANGNYHFLSGDVSGVSVSLEIRPFGAPNFAFFWESSAYRSFRMKDLYSGD